MSDYKHHHHNRHHSHSVEYAVVFLVWMGVLIALAKLMYEIIY